MYNIRGWMTQINDPANLGTDLFGYKIKYTNPQYTSLASAKYNGNIAEIDWKTAKDGVLKRYSYQYDALNRLQSGLYSEPDASIPQNGYYNETLSYDLNGNIQNLQRNRYIDYFGIKQIDNLTYTYTGNQLNTVTDASLDYFGYPDFSGNIIHYDLNGNMTDHVDKGILQLNYNHLNLPNYVKFNDYVTRYDPFNGGTSTVYKNTTYLYRADGIKLKKVHNYFSGRTKIDTSITTEYLDGFQYSFESGYPIAPQGLQFIPTSEGYYDFTQNKYIYQYKDQVGNIRLSFYKDALGSAVIDRTNDYYPFGLEFGGSGITSTDGSVSPNYTYTFQGQERQQETGWNSFKWRNYDPSMGRFFNVDPLSEKYAYQSHYNFSENRVVDGRELEGLEVILANDTEHNQPIIKAANSEQYKDNSNTKTIHVFAHGNPLAMYNEKVTSKQKEAGLGTINSGEKLNDVLNQGSDLWKNSESKDGFTIVLHACRTGRYTLDSEGNVIDPVASLMSESNEMKVVTIIAPDERDGFSANGKEIGPQETKYTDHNGNYLPGTPRSEQGKQTSQFGYWNSFKNGQRTNKQPGNTKPEGKDERSLLDKIFN